MSDVITLVSQLPGDQEAAYLAALRKALPDEVLLPVRETSALQRAESSIAMVAIQIPATSRDCRIWLGFRAFGRASSDSSPHGRHTGHRS